MQRSPVGLVGLASLVVLSACGGFDSEDALTVARFLHDSLGCPDEREVVDCPDGGTLDRSSGTLVMEGCTDEELALDGAGLEVLVGCGQTGALIVSGAFTLGDGRACDLDLDVRSVLGECGGIFGPFRCEEQWTITATVCGIAVGETCDRGGFLEPSDCH